MLDNSIGMDLMLLCMGLGWLIITVGPWILLGMAFNLAVHGFIACLRGDL